MQFWRLTCCFLYTKDVLTFLQLYGCTCCWGQCLEGQVTKGSGRIWIKWHNVGMSGLCFSSIPNKSLKLKNEVCKGEKMATERLIIMRCCSAAGDK